MYLAEDRVLTFEIVSAPQRHWVLRWVAGSVAETGESRRNPALQS